MQSIWWKISLFLFCTSFTSRVAGQEYEIQHWSLEEGLSNSTVNDILQDRYGFIWIATAHGLNRFDGYQFKNFRYHPLDSTSIGGNHIENVIETEDGTFWAILSIGGLARWHRNDETFSYYNHFDPDTSGTRIINVTDLVQVKAGQYLIGSREGLYLLENQGYKPEPLITTLADSIPFVVNKLAIDKKGRIWVSTFNGIYRYNLENNDVSPLLFYHPDLDSLVHIRSALSHLFEDQQGRTWVGTSRSGIFLFDEKSESLQGHWQQIDSTLSTWQTVTQIAQQRDGKIWGTIKQQGLFFYDEHQGQFQKFKNDNLQHIQIAIQDTSDNIWLVANENQIFRLKGEHLEAFELPGRNNEWFMINDLFIDREQALWIGSGGKGLWRFSKKRWLFETLKALKNEKLNPSPSSHVTAVLEDSKKNIWIGTKMGLIKSDSSFQDFEFYNPNQPPNQSLSGYYVMSLMEDHEGHIWVGTTYGISVLDKNGWVVKKYRHSNEQNGTLSNNHIWSIAQDSAQRIWVATNEGLNLYQPQKDSFISFLNKPGDPNSLSGNNIRQIIPSHVPDTYWVGLTGAGLNRVRYFPETDSISCQYYFFESAHQHSKKIATINTVYEDHNHQLWVGAYSMGLLKYDQEQDKLINAQPDIPTIPNIASIVEDEDGNLWVGANNGLWQHKPKERSFRQFTPKNGLSSLQFSYQAVCRGQNGKLFFGNNNGLDFFHPQNIGPAAKVVPPLIYGFRKYDQQIHFEKPVYDLSEIAVTYKDNYIHFDFLSPVFLHQEEVRYAYQLEGFDQDWHFCKTPGQANYTNLPGGSYTFKVKAGNAEGWWNPQLSQLRVEVIPPFWARLWFKLIVVLAIILLIVFIFRLRWALKMQQLNKIAKIREKAAADFHDELGHRLTKISLFSETLLRIFPGASQELKPYLEKIKSNSDELYHSLRDFVWVMNPQKDSLFELAILLKDFGDDLFDTTSIDFRVQGIDPHLKSFILEMEWKRHLVLIFKEAMHNALKHSQCQNVTLSFAIQHRKLMIKLSDDGLGFTPDEKRQGYGIGNMKSRAQKIGGALSINGVVGTCVHFEGVLRN